MNTVLVIPCFNEKSRLQIENFRSFAARDRRLLFVDDGSSDETAMILKQKFAGDANIKVLCLSKNQGKAEAVRSGVLSLKQMWPETDFEWIGFWDADLATPLSEVQALLDYQRLIFPKAQAVFASRVALLGYNIHRTYHRHYLGRLFATAIDFYLGLRPYDSQCGAKLFHCSVIDRVFSEAFLSRWIFDVEILMRLRESFVVECPVRSWQDIPGSKMNLRREAFRVLGDSRKIRQRYGKAGAQAVIR
jgi:dolichyl-phosphate beta-glucosyltransferase